MTRTSPRASDRARGFTLVEMLVTLVIMALLAGLATLSAGGNAERQARSEMARIRELLSYASDEATFQGEELGLLVDEGAYRVLRFDPESEAWADVSEKPLDAHSLPPGLSLELSLLDSADLPRGQDDSDAPVPEILLSSSGEISGFRLDIRVAPGEDPVASLESDGSGTLRDL